MKYHKKNKAGDFRVPEGYFDTLEDRIIERALREGKLPQKDGFEVPSGYMDGMEDRMTKVLKEQQPETTAVLKREKPVYTLRDIAYAISATAAAIVILMTVFNVDFSAPEHGSSNAMANIAPEDIEFYIENDMLPLDTQYIAEIMDTADLNAISFSTLDDDEVINYLEEHLTDYSDLNFND